MYSIPTTYATGRLANEKTFNVYDLVMAKTPYLFALNVIIGEL